MKVLSGRQPWWWAILRAGKRIENRRWNTKYRGPILLHAAKGCTLVEWGDAARWMIRAGVSTSDQIPKLEALQRGGIVGRATIVDVITPQEDIPPSFRRPYPEGVDHRWHMTEQFGFVLEDVQPLPFLPCKGALSLFTPTPEMLEHVAKYDETRRQALETGAFL